MQISYFNNLRTNAVALVLIGVISFSAVFFLLRLPERIKTGQQGQAAIQMLDEMRRPFLAIKQIEADLAETADVEASNSALSLAIGSANDMLKRYTALASYNTTLLSEIEKLTETFENWVAVQSHFISSFETASGHEGDDMQLANGLTQCFFSAESGFLKTMDVLGAGELPIHADIADGRKAIQYLIVLGNMLLLYFIGVAFWLQRISSKRKRRILLERVRSEHEAHALQQDLNDALGKVLSGFVSICASCKSIRNDDDQWTQVETYVTQKTEVHFSHGFCPDCFEKLYGDEISQKRSREQRSVNAD